MPSYASDQHSQELAVGNGVASPSDSHVLREGQENVTVTDALIKALRETEETSQAALAPASPPPPSRPLPPQPAALRADGPIGPGAGLEEDEVLAQRVRQFLDIMNRLEQEITSRSRKRATFTKGMNFGAILRKEQRAIEATGVEYALFRSLLLDISKPARKKIIRLMKIPSSRAKEAPHLADEVVIKTRAAWIHLLVETMVKMADEGASLSNLNINILIFEAFLVLQGKPPGYYFLRLYKTLMSDEMTLTLRKLSERTVKMLGITSSAAGLEEPNEGWIASESSHRVTWAPLGRKLLVPFDVRMPEGSTWLFHQFISDNRQLFSGRFLELGTGVGPLAIDLARGGAEVVALDVLPLAVEAATQNSKGESSDVQSRIQVGVSNLYSDLPRITGEAKPRFDGVLFNNPVRLKHRTFRDPHTFSSNAGPKGEVVQGALQGLPQVLKPGKAAYFLALKNPSNSNEYWSRDHLERYKPNGWQVEPVGESWVIPDMKLEFSVFRVTPPGTALLSTSAGQKIPSAGLEEGAVQPVEEPEERLYPVATSGDWELFVGAVRKLTEEQVSHKLQESFESFEVRFDAVYGRKTRKFHPEWALVKGPVEEWWIHLHLVGLGPDSGLLFRLEFSPERTIEGLIDPMAEPWFDDDREEKGLEGFVPLAERVKERWLSRLIARASRTIRPYKKVLEDTIRQGTYKSTLAVSVRPPGAESLLFEILTLGTPSLDSSRRIPRLNYIPLHEWPSLEAALGSLAAAGLEEGGRGLTFLEAARTLAELSPWSVVTFKGLPSGKEEYRFTLVRPLEVDGIIRAFATSYRDKAWGSFNVEPLDEPHPDAKLSGQTPPAGSRHAKVVAYPAAGLEEGLGAYARVVAETVVPQVREALGRSAVRSFRRETARVVFDEKVTHPKQALVLGEDGQFWIHWHLVTENHNIGLLSRLILHDGYVVGVKEMMAEANALADGGSAERLTGFVSLEGRLSRIWFGMGSLDWLEFEVSEQLREHNLHLEDAIRRWQAGEWQPLFVLGKADEQSDARGLFEILEVEALVASGTDTQRLVSAGSAEGTTLYRSAVPVTAQGEEPAAGLEEGSPEELVAASEERLFISVEPLYQELNRAGADSKGVVDPQVWRGLWVPGLLQAAFRRMNLAKGTFASGHDTQGVEHLRVALGTLGDIRSTPGFAEATPQRQDQMVQEIRPMFVELLRLLRQLDRKNWPEVMDELYVKRILSRLAQFERIAWVDFGAMHDLILELEDKYVLASHGQPARHRQQPYFQYRRVTVEETPTDWKQVPLYRSDKMIEKLREELFEAGKDREFVLAVQKQRETGEPMFYVEGTFRPRRATAGLEEPRVVQIRRELLGIRRPGESLSSYVLRRLPWIGEPRENLVSLLKGLRPAESPRYVLAFENAHRYLDAKRRGPWTHVVQGRNSKWAHMHLAKNDAALRRGKPNFFNGVLLRIVQDESGRIASLEDPLVELSIAVDLLDPEFKEFIALGPMPGERMAGFIEPSYVENLKAAALNLARMHEDELVQVIRESDERQRDPLFVLARSVTPGQPGLWLMRRLKDLPEGKRYIFHPRGIVYERQDLTGPPTSEQQQELRRLLQFSSAHLRWYPDPRYAYPFFQVRIHEKFGSQKYAEASRLAEDDTRIGLVLFNGDSLQNATAIIYTQRPGEDNITLDLLIGGRKDSTGGTLHVSRPSLAKMLLQRFSEAIEQHLTSTTARIPPTGNNAYGILNAVVDQHTAGLEEVVGAFRRLVAERFSELEGYLPAEDEVADLTDTGVGRALQQMAQRANLEGGELLAVPTTRFRGVAPERAIQTIYVPSQWRDQVAANFQGQNRYRVVGEQERDAADAEVIGPTANREALLLENKVLFEVQNARDAGTITPGLIDRLTKQGLILPNIGTLIVIQSLFHQDLEDVVLIFA